jgi:signal transduction histidine kinase
MKTTELSDEALLHELQRRLMKKSHLLDAQTRLVSELEKLNEKLREVERVKSGFLSNIRNEINNPLTAILGLSRQISGLDSADDRIRRCATLINKEAFQLDFQLRNIFSAAEIEAGEVAVCAAVVDINELVRNQIRYFHLKAEQNGIVIDFEAIPQKHFKTDGALFNAIVMNLLSNAIEYSLPGGKVIVDCKVVEGKLVLQVIDYGKGINPADIKQMFQRFVQLESGTTKTHQGHGLGLSIVKEFTDLLGGEIDIKSEVGVETIVTVTLPEFALDEVPSGFAPGGDEILFDEGEIL